jgi:hypothetical protein
MIYTFALITLLTTSGTTASETVERDSAGLAREVARNTKFDRPLLFQVEYSTKLEPTYSVMPLDTGKKSEEFWRLMYTPGHSRKEVAPKTWFSQGKLPDKPIKSAEVETGKSFQMAIKKIDEAGRLNFPFIVFSRESKTAWLFHFEPAPRVPDSFITVTVAKRDRKAKILPGL